MAVDVVCEREIPRPREEVAAYAASLNEPHRLAGG
jgi:hypothetical protein